MTVVQVPSDDSIVAGGAIHCVTRTIPVLPGKSVDVTDVPEFQGMNVTIPLAPLTNNSGSAALDQLLTGW